MSDVVYKYQLPFPESTIMLPLGAEVLSAGIKGDFFFVWARVERGAQNHVQRKFHVIGTGIDMPPVNLKFISTIFINDFVFHVFEEKD